MSSPTYKRWLVLGSSNETALLCVQATATSPACFQRPLSLCSGPPVHIRAQQRQERPIPDLDARHQSSDAGLKAAISARQCGGPQCQGSQGQPVELLVQCSHVLDAEGESEVQQQAGARQGVACSMVVLRDQLHARLLVVGPEACRFTVHVHSWQLFIDAERRSWVCSSRQVLCHGGRTALALPSSFASACVLHEAQIALPPTCWAVLWQ